MEHGGDEEEGQKQHHALRDETRRDETTGSPAREQWGVAPFTARRWQLAATRHGLAGEAREGEERKADWFFLCVLGLVSHRTLAHTYADAQIGLILFFCL